MEYENSKNNPMVENDKVDSILDSDKGEYHDTKLLISTCKDGFQEYDYEIKLTLLKNLIENVLLNSIRFCHDLRNCKILSEKN
ncbi:hypothetical protein RhiirA4_481107 [Rhizophagus irregularis]|uniref:Uncharacterized protein n=1 Tax=Rhizophagus irregularis TaxID=588596 RepID=A0A2I1HJ20_9GLOM|nr:hypothetical protein RhiirA4_481107 [Rhizophagus irregularis]